MTALLRKGAHRLIGIIIWSLIYVTVANGSQSWQTRLDQTIKELSVVADEAPIFLADPGDISNYQQYYPFAAELKRAIRSSLLAEKKRLVEDPLKTDLFFYTGFEISPDSLSLVLELKESQTGNIVSAEMLTIPKDDLPEDFDRRSLEDVAFELSLKLERELFLRKITFARDGISFTDNNGLISEFSSTLKAYLTRELIRRGSFRRVEVDQEGAGLFQLTGVYESVAGNILLSLEVVDSAGKDIVARAESTIEEAALPEDLRLKPQNQQVATTTVEPEDSIVPSGLEDSLKMWVNKDSGIYNDGDHLIVNVKPERDLYLRLYYVMSDGAICQIFPSGTTGSGFVRENRVYQIGGPSDGVELVISDETLGQEVIKAFASVGPIDDKSLPKIFVESANISCMADGYQQLQSGLSRALKLNFKVRPVAEVQILVSDKKAGDSS